MSRNEAEEVLSVVSLISNSLHSKTLILKIIRLKNTINHTSASAPYQSKQIKMQVNLYYGL
jgi:hypothetical protein